MNYLCKKKTLNKQFSPKNNLCRVDFLLPCSESRVADEYELDLDVAKTSTQIKNK